MTQGYRGPPGRSRRLDMNRLNFRMPCRPLAVCSASRTCGARVPGVDVPIRAGHVPECAVWHGFSRTKWDMAPPGNPQPGSHAPSVQTMSRFAQTMSRIAQVTSRNVLPDTVPAARSGTWLRRATGIQAPMPRLCRPCPDSRRPCPELRRACPRKGGPSTPQAAESGTRLVADAADATTHDAPAPSAGHGGVERMPEPRRRGPDHRGARTRTSAPRPESATRAHEPGATTGTSPTRAHDLGATPGVPAAHADEPGATAGIADSRDSASGAAAEPRLSRGLGRGLSRGRGRGRANAAEDGRCAWPSVRLGRGAGRSAGRRSACRRGG